MALNRYYNHRPFFTTGFDELFFPTPFFKEMEDLMPVVANANREQDFSLLRSSPGYEISESDGKYQIHVDVPGVKAADMDISVNEGVLKITGGRKTEKDGVVSESKFEKRFTVGDNIEIDKLSANLENGVLTLTAPKKEKTEKPVHKIAITEGPMDTK